MQVQIVEVKLDRQERAIYSAYETKAANALADVLNNAAERADRCPHRRHAIVRILRLKQGKFLWAFLTDDLFIIFRMPSSQTVAER